MQPVKRELEIKAQPPLKRGKTNRLSTNKLAYSDTLAPLPYAFIDAINELNRRFNVYSDRVICNKIVTYLKQNFNQRIDYKNREALTTLHASVAKTKRILLRDLIQSFLKKDEGFLYRDLPLEIRNHILSYLDRTDYLAAKEFVRGDLNRFRIYWINEKNGNFTEVVDLKKKASEKFVSFYGNELKSFDVCRASFNDLISIAKHTTNLSRLVLREIDFHEDHDLLNDFMFNIETAGLTKLKFIDIALFDRFHVSKHQDMDQIVSFTLKNSHCRICESSLSRLGTMTQLRSLNLSGNTLHLNDLNMESLNKLTKLGLENVRLENGSLGNKLSSLTNLLVLKIGKNRFNIGDRSAIGNLTSLTKLSINNTGQWTLESQKKLVNLIKLDLSKNNLGSITLSVISRLSLLTTLFLADCDLEDQNLLGISKLERLETLKLCNNELKSPWHHLAPLTNLQSLSLQLNSELKGLDLATLSKLDHLNLGYTRLGSRGMKRLRVLTHLTSLYLHENPIGNAGLKKLTCLSKLEDLDLDDCKITRQGAEFIAAAFTQLRLLCLNNNSISNEGALALKGLHRLRSLELVNTDIDNKTKIKLKRHFGLVVTV